MKLCLIIHSLGIGGMERVMVQLAENFAARQSTQVDLILIGRKRRVEYPLSPSVSIHQPKFEFDNTKRSEHTLKTMGFLRKKVKEINPDTILSFGEYWNNLVLISLYGLPYPIYISDRSQPNKDLGKAQNFLRNLLYSRAAGYIAQTEEAQKVCFSKKWNENVRVIGNPIREIQTNGQDKRENIVLSVGRLIKTKHFDQLIRIFLEIGNPKWKLVIVGGDAKKQTLSKQLQQLVKDLGAEGQIFLEGEQQDIESYYRKSKIFAFTSSSEGFPNVIGEALSAGLPVVAYDCMAGPSDMISNGENGFLVPMFDEEGFKQKLGMLMDNEILREEISNRTADVLNNFKVDKIADRFFEFIIQSQEDNAKVE